MTLSPAHRGSPHPRPLDLLWIEGELHPQTLVGSGPGVVEIHRRLVRGGRETEPVKVGLANLRSGGRFRAPVPDPWLEEIGSYFQYAVVVRQRVGERLITIFDGLAGARWSQMEAA